MAHLARVVIPGHPHHVTQRDNGRATYSAMPIMRTVRESQLAYYFPAFAFPPALSSSSSALRTCLNSSSDALSAFGNFRSSFSSALTMAEPITTRANHLWSAGTTCHGASAVE